MVTVELTTVKGVIPVGQIIEVNLELQAKLKGKVKPLLRIDERPIPAVILRDGCDRSSITTLLLRMPVIRPMVVASRRNDLSDLPPPAPDTETISH